MDWGLLDHSTKTVFVIPLDKNQLGDAEEYIREIQMKWHLEFLEYRRQKIDKIMGKINEKRQL
jgi:hypothetical protein